MITKPTLFFAPSCDFCHEVVDEIGPLFAARNVELLVRMPSLRERVEITQVPALFIPVGFFGLTKPHLLVGSSIPQWILSLITQEA